MQFGGVPSLQLGFLGQILGELKGEDCREGGNTEFKLNTATATHPEEAQNEAGVPEQACEFGWAVGWNGTWWFFTLKRGAKNPHKHVKNHKETGKR